MTHDELLAKIVNYPDSILFAQYYRALRAIAELHYPWIYTNYRGQEIPFCRGCYRGVEDGFDEYPCPTIRAIEKELQ